jgi:hypothetical protein
MVLSQARVQKFAVCCGFLFAASFASAAPAASLAPEAAQQPPIAKQVHGSEAAADNLQACCSASA